MKDVSFSFHHMGPWDEFRQQIYLLSRGGTRLNKNEPHRLKEHY